MPMYIDSYTTTTGSSIDARRLASAIKEAIVTDDLDTKPEAGLNIKPIGGFYPLFITGTYPGEEKIPSFAHPISILNIRGKNIISSDLRLFLKKEVNSDFNKRISNRLDFDYAVSRTVLNLMWASGKNSEFISGFGFAGEVFAKWISQIFAGGLGLEAQDSLVVQITALAYYYTLCSDNPLALADDKQKMIDWIYARTGADPIGIEKVVAKLSVMTEFSHFIENLKVVVDNIRIQKMSVGGFLTSIRSSWYGVNSAQVLGVCIEHPPTWTAIVHHTLASKGYQRCLIGQVALAAGRRGNADGFMRHYSTMFGESLKFENFKSDDQAEGVNLGYLDDQTSSIKEIVNPEADNHFNYDAAELALEAHSRIPAL